jgi:hypothetical protein
MDTACLDYCPRLKKIFETGEIVLFDDCTDRHVAKVIRFIRTNYLDILKPLEIRRYENPQKGLKKRIGNLLGIRQLVGFEKAAEPPRKWNAKFASF